MIFSFLLSCSISDDTANAHKLHAFTSYQITVTPEADKWKRFWKMPLPMILSWREMNCSAGTCFYFKGAIVDNSTPASYVGWKISDFLFLAVYPSISLSTQAVLCWWGPLIALTSGEKDVYSLTVVRAMNFGYQDIQAWLLSSAFSTEASYWDYLHSGGEPSKAVRLTNQ